MKFKDLSEMKDQDLIACYPRRIEKGDSYELWKFPYVEDDVLFNDNLVFVEFRENMALLILISEFDSQVFDSFYMDRISVLVEGIYAEYHTEAMVIDDLDSEITLDLLEDLRQGRFDWRWEDRE